MQLDVERRDRREASINVGWTVDNKARDTYNFFIYSKIFDEWNKNLEQSYVNFIELDDCKSSATILTMPTNYKDVRPDPSPSLPRS